MNAESTAASAGPEPPSLLERPVLLTVAEVAAVLKRGKSTLYRDLARTGTVAGMRTIRVGQGTGAGGIRVPSTEVDRLLAGEIQGQP